MPNLCEKCPIITKVDYCCGSNPETGAIREVKMKKNGLTIIVCADLQNDGRCGIYDKRPQDCISYACEELYAQGLGAQRY